MRTASEMFSTVSTLIRIVSTSAPPMVPMYLAAPAEDRRAPDDNRRDRHEDVGIARGLGAIAGAAEDQQTGDGGEEAAQRVGRDLDRAVGTPEMNAARGLLPMA